MAMSDALNIAVIGAGRMGCTHLRALAGASRSASSPSSTRRPAARSRAESLSPGVRTHADLAGAVARRWHRGGADRGAVQPARRPGRGLCGAAAPDPVREAVRHDHRRDRSRRRRLSRRRGAAADRILATLRARADRPAAADPLGRARRDRARLVLAVGRRAGEPRVPACERWDHGRHGSPRVRPDPLAHGAGDRRADARDLAGELGRAGAGRRRELRDAGRAVGRRGRRSSRSAATSRSATTSGSR